MSHETDKKCKNIYDNILCAKMVYDITKTSQYTSPTDLNMFFCKIFLRTNQFMYLCMIMHNVFLKSKRVKIFNKKN